MAKITGLGGLFYKVADPTRTRAKYEEMLGRQDEPYGLFAWILDCDGIKVEFWQQIGEAP